MLGVEMMMKSFGIDPDEIKKQIGEFGQIMSSIRDELIVARQDRARHEAKLDALLKHHGIEIEFPAAGPVAIAGPHTAN